MVQLGRAVATSRGEWTSGLREDEVDRLLKTLESRLPKDRIFSSLPGLARLRTATLDNSAESFEKQQQARPFKRLQILADRIQCRHLGGYSACWELPNQTDQDRNVYLDIIRQGSKVNLFHGKEKKSKSEREKFLEPLKMAAQHLLNAYFKDTSSRDEPELSLSQHPSSGMKETSNRIYSLLWRHWQCNCEHSTTGPHGQREARLSLVRHHALALKLSSSWNEALGRVPKARYEILLPVCEEKVKWKVTNVEVNNDTRRYALIIMAVIRPGEKRSELRH